MLYYCFAKSSWIDALLVMDGKGILHYASLGSNRQVLVNIMKKDYAKYNNSKKKKFAIMPQYKKEVDYNNEIFSTVENYTILLENPDRIGTKDEVKIKISSDIGTEFQRKVWNYLMNNTSPLKTTTYGEIATNLNLEAKHARAIGGACGSNRIALLIPCHRVLGSTGKLTGYKWGTQVKQKLLILEKNLL